MKIGVLALQGDFAEHITMLKGIGVEAIEVRLASQSNGTPSDARLTVSKQTWRSLS
jgi:glutamine amidotransferase PdxT